MADEPLNLGQQVAAQSHLPADLERRANEIARREPDRCPPHNFHSAYVSDEKGGAIYCRWCGEIRVLEVPAIEAPAEERVNAREQDAR